MNSPMKIALIGANGMLATMLKSTLPETTKVYPFDLPEFDITNMSQVQDLLGHLRPQVIINCAAFTKVDLCESQQEVAFKVNGEGPANLAAITQQIDAILVHISTDFVFDGEQSTPYREDAFTHPLSVYGQSKLRGEQAIIQSSLIRYYIVRTSWLYGPGGPNFVETISRLAAEREELGIVADQRGTPTYTEDLAEAIVTLLGVGSHSPSPYGIYHYSNEGECSWYEFACKIVEALQDKGVDLKVKKINPLQTHEYPVPAKRPPYSVLSKDKFRRVTGSEVPEWCQSLKKYFEVRGFLRQ